MTEVTSTYKGTTETPVLDRARGGQSRRSFQHDATMAAASGVTRETWADRMGVNAGPVPSSAACDAIAALGLKWVSISPERGWNTDVEERQIVEQIKKGWGLNVQVVLQQAAHAYDFGLPGVSAFADWGATWVDKGVDEIAVGCEWNNAPFWAPTPDPTMTGAALIHGVTLQRIRAKSKTIPVYTCGWSPAGGALAPATAMNALCLQLSAQGVEPPSAFTGPGMHPYCYEAPLSWGLPDHQDWNAFAQTPTVVNVARSHGMTGPLNIGEYGCPSAGTDTASGVTFTEELQMSTIAQYFAGIAQWRTQGIDVARLFLSTAIDGDASTRDLERTMGLQRADGSFKPAADVVRIQSRYPW